VTATARDPVLLRLETMLAELSAAIHRLDCRERERAKEERLHLLYVMACAQPMGTAE
jgi:hypothetical protein